MNQPENDDRLSDEPVWDLLEHASKVEAGPFFARNVVREVRLDATRQSGWFASLKEFFTPRAVVFGSTVAAAIAIALVIFPVPQEEVGSGFADDRVEAFDPASEFEEVEYRGQLMAVVDPGQLSDEALVDLFF